MVISTMFGHNVTQLYVLVIWGWEISKPKAFLCWGFLTNITNIFNMSIVHSTTLHGHLTFVGLLTQLEIPVLIMYSTNFQGPCGAYVGIKYVLSKICGHRVGANKVAYLKASYFREGPHTIGKF